MIIVNLKIYLNIIALFFYKNCKTNFIFNIKQYFIKFNILMKNNYSWSFGSLRKINNYKFGTMVSLW